MNPHEFKITIQKAPENAQLIIVDLKHFSYVDDKSFHVSSESWSCIESPEQDTIGEVLAAGCQWMNKSIKDNDHTTE